MKAGQVSNFGGRYFLFYLSHPLQLPRVCAEQTAVIEVILRPCSRILPSQLKFDFRITEEKERLSEVGVFSRKEISATTLALAIHIPTPTRGFPVLGLPLVERELGERHTVSPSRFVSRKS